MDCLQCGKVFLGTNTKFCSIKCYKDHLKDAEEDLNKVVKETLGKEKDQ